MLRRFSSIVLLLAALVCTGDALAQRPAPSAQELANFDFSKVRVDDLSDAQIREILRRAEDRGLSVGDLERLAVARGMHPSEVVKFRARLRRIDPERQGFDSLQRDSLFIATEEDSIGDPFSVLTEQRRLRRESRLRDVILSDSTLTSDERDSLLTELDQFEIMREDRDEDRPKIFGEDLFKSEALTFEPSLNIPTPPDYQLAAGDELVIDVWGAAEMTYQLPVTRDGTIRIENLGPVFVNGLTMAEAEQKIISRLSELYSGLNSTSASEQNMYADVSLGGVRTINVHILGEVKYPGSYSLPSMSTMFNALYVCSGPNENGTYRSIRVVRDNQIVAELDIYEFLVEGTLEGNIRLRDQDIVKVDPYISRVQVEGNVKRPGFFETRPNETMAELLAFAGGFSQDAYTRRLKIHRETQRERRILTVSSREFASFPVSTGDHVFVDEILDRFENRVEIEGAVYRPGEYQLEDAQTVYGLIEQAEGLKGDALMSRGQIYRTLPDQTVKLIPFDVRKLIGSPSESDIPLVKDDVVSIPSRKQLQEPYVVTIHGSVQSAGAYPYVEDMTLQDLIVMAGGLMEEASLERIEVSRRQGEFDPSTPGGEIARISQFDIDDDLSLDGDAANFRLKQFDEVFVRRSPNYIEQRNVEVTGEVLYPGVYTAVSKDYHISDIIRRSGGLSPDAYAQGAVLVRTLEDTRFAAGTIGIDLHEIMNNPGSAVDLLVEPGDSIHVPQRLETVNVRGAVYHPANIRYQRGMDLMDYIDQAGGTTDQADLRRTYVVYANGSVDKINRTLFWRSYPNMEPGAAIVVPTRPEEEGMTVQERTMIWSSIVSVAAVVSTAIVQLTR